MYYIYTQDRIYHLADLWSTDIFRPKKCVLIVLRLGPLTMYQLLDILL